MTPRKKDTEPTKGAFDFVDLITGRIGKITALLAAIGGLALLILTQSEQILAKLTALGLYTPPPCVQIEPLMIPATVKYSEWDSMKLKLKGRNNCSTPLGLFVTFVPRSARAAPHRNQNAGTRRSPSAQVRATGSGRSCRRRWRN